MLQEAADVNLTTSVPPMVVTCEEAIETFTMNGTLFDGTPVADVCCDACIRDPFVIEGSCNQWLDALGSCSEVVLGCNQTLIEFCPTCDDSVLEPSESNLMTTVLFFPFQKLSKRGC